MQDNTLITTKSRKEFPVDADDWDIYNDQIRNKLGKLHNDGYGIVVFTNKPGINDDIDSDDAMKIRKIITNFQLQMGSIPIQFVIATNNKTTKPRKFIWNFFVTHMNNKQEPVLQDSFFVGKDNERGYQSVNKYVD